MTYKIAVVGATGAVGREMLQTLYERKFPIDKVYALASSKSPGRQVSFGDELTIDVEPIEKFDFTKVDFAFFSAGGSVSEKYAPIAGKSGALVIDNSSAFRMKDNVPLIVPEVNHYDLKGCLVDNDSNLRFHDATQLRYINQLPKLKNAGFYGKGDFDVDAESIIQSGNITRVDRPCNVLSGVSIDNLQPALFPMIDRLKSEVQNNIHLIPEDSMTSWVRGGLPSRQIARNVDYINRCEQLKNNGINK